MRLFDPNLEPYNQQLRKKDVDPARRAGSLVELQRHYSASSEILDSLSDLLIQTREGTML
jgi:hypothetical protein